MVFGERKPGKGSGTRSGSGLHSSVPASARMLRSVHPCSPPTPLPLPFHACTAPGSVVAQRTDPAEK